MTLGTDIGFEGRETPPVTIAGQPLLLSELINNLLDNALRYTPPGGHVTVRVACLPNGVAQLDIEDFGPGIATSERVFDRFYRVLGSHADGSGLGLAIVREIAHKHCATVRIMDPDRHAKTAARDDAYDPDRRLADLGITMHQPHTSGTLIRVSFAPVTFRTGDFALIEHRTYPSKPPVSHELA